MSYELYLLTLTMSIVKFIPYKSFLVRERTEIAWLATKLHFKSCHVFDIWIDTSIYLHIYKTPVLNSWTTCSSILSLIGSKKNFCSGFYRWLLPDENFHKALIEIHYRSTATWMAAKFIVIFFKNTKCK